MHVVAPDPVGEVGEVRFGAGQQELVLAGAQDDAVLDDEAAVVEPAGVLGVARRTGTDVAGEHAGQELLGILPVIRYLNSGLESKMPAALRTAKYSNLSDIWYRSAAR